MLKRNLIPGSEWLYCKLYTGTKSADKIVVEIVKPFTDRLKSLGLITGHFFIRYSDPKFHIRLRLKLTDMNSFNGIMQEFVFHFEKAYITELINEIQFNTYKREVERYGEHSIEIAESIFCYDSVCVVDIIEQLRDSGDSDKDRWMLALILIDDLLNNVGYNLEEKSDLLLIMSNNFKNEFGITSSAYTKPLNEKYRSNRKQIEDVLLRKDIYLQFEKILNSRNNSIKTNIVELKEILDNPDNISMKDLLPSIIHMTMNRLFRSNNRLCEMVVYHLLSKSYVSQLAMSKQHKKE